ncbi:MAG: class II aldolase/adducin family protein [Planctomycetota bacterium]
MHPGSPGARGPGNSRDLQQATAPNRHDLTTITGGNISVRDDTERIWITPAGVDKAIDELNDAFP